MRLPALTSFFGFIMIIVASYCPILHVLLINQNVYQLNKPFGLVFLLIAVVGILGTVLNNPKLTKLTAYISLGAVILFYIASLLKIHTSFDFIPIHAFGRYLTGKITFKWGWYVMCAGAFLAVAGTLVSKNLSNIKVD